MTFYHISGSVRCTAPDTATLLGLIKRQSVFSPVQELKLQCDFEYVGLAALITCCFAGYFAVEIMSVGIVVWLQRVLVEEWLQFSLSVLTKYMCRVCQ